MKHFPHPVILFIFIFSCFIAGSCNLTQGKDSVHLNIDGNPFEKVSDYNFFKDCSDLTKPNKGVIPYTLINSMFSDYSKRETFMYVPEGLSLGIDSTDLLNLPVGSCLINIVYYLKDERNLSSTKQLIETQLLIRKQTGWQAFDYRWNEDQKDALLFNSDDLKEVSWTDKNGTARQVSFHIPTATECKICHLRGNQFFPIGIKAGNLNTSVDYPTGRKNQFDHWAETGLLKHFTKESAVPYLNWRDTSLAVNERAKAYLNANCAYCHKYDGAARVSGLFFNADNNNLSYGICKPTVAKGRATCSMNYDIVPGKPEQSAIICRMCSNEEGIKMPEYGRMVVDSEGLSLITTWIKQLRSDCK